MSENLPLLTPEGVQNVCERDRARWFAALPIEESASYTRLGWKGLLALRNTTDALRTATDAPTVRRRDDLRRVVEEILTQRWLRVYDHHDDTRQRNAPLLGFPIPEYRTPEELVGASLSYQDALQELWQRDVGDALPALALGAFVFPEIATDCQDRMKAIIMASLEFPTWGAFKPYVDMDLSVAHLGRGIAIAYDWHRAIWTDAERDRLFTVLRQKLGTLLRGAYGAAFWARGWTDNHCQNAFAALGICGACFLGEIPEAEEWLGAAIAGFEIALPLCNADGSSAEGVPYWSYGLSFLLQYIELTRDMTGADTLYEAPYLRHSVHYRLHCSLPDLSGSVTFGDADLQDYYGPSHLLYALARQYQDEAAQWFGDAIPFPNRSGADIEAWALLWRDSTLPAAIPTELPLDTHLSSWDVAMTRSGWGSRDYVLAVKSGYTNRNHSHLDAGTVLFGWGNEWLIDAPGYGKVGPGFWDIRGPRWDYYSNATESHSTLLINGKKQRFDAAARGMITQFESMPEMCHISINLTNAYEDVLQVQRQIFHRRGQYILVLDEIEGYDLNQVEWLLQPGKTCGVQMDANTAILKGVQGAISIQALAPAGNAAPVFVPRMPTAPHLDIPQEAVRTLALHAEGSKSHAAFAVLIVPDFATDITAHIEAWGPGQRIVMVHGSDFMDLLQ